MCIHFLDPQNAKNAFEFPAKTRVNIVKKITLLGSPNSWHQDLEFGPRMDIFGQVIFLCEVIFLGRVTFLGGVIFLGKVIF